MTQVKGSGESTQRSEMSCQKAGVVLWTCPNGTRAELNGCQPPLISPQCSAAIHGSPSGVIWDKWYLLCYQSEDSLGLKALLGKMGHAGSSVGCCR